MVGTGGIEPPPTGFVIRHIVQLCYLRVTVVRPNGLSDDWLLITVRWIGGECRSRTCPTRRSRRVSTAVPCRSANSPKTIRVLFVVCLERFAPILHLALLNNCLGLEWSAKGQSKARPRRVSWN